MSGKVSDLLHGFGFSFISDSNYMEPQGFVYQLIAQELKKHGENKVDIYVHESKWSASRPLPEWLTRSLENYALRFGEMATRLQFEAKDFSELTLHLSLLPMKAHGKEVACRVSAKYSDGRLYETAVGSHR